MPTSKLSVIDQKYKNKKVVFKSGGFITYKYYVEHLKYKFPILVQTLNGQVTDFYTKLPSYFLHDVFHQSIINRFGKQDFYKKTEESALYIWKNSKNLNNLKIIYSGACTITCFPLFYSVVPVNHNYGSSFKPVLKKMQESFEY